MFRLLTGLFFLLPWLGDLSAQAPATQLYVFDLQVKDTAVTLTNPRYLTAFNPNGYNNHPNWAGDQQLFASVMTPDMAQPDVYLFDLAAGTRTRLTQTASGEYSPKKRFATGRFSAVRQEMIGRDTILRLWDFPLDRSDNGQPLPGTAAGVGYYEWLNNSQLALFLVENPNRLVLASATGDAPRTLATNTGRTFTRLPNGNLVYVDKSATPWRLMEKNLYQLNESATVVGEMPDATEDFVVLSDGSYLAGSGSKLYRLNPAAAEKGWRQVVDLTFYGFDDITRLAVNGRGQLALVARP
ncbi:hypothetical protein GGR26_001487 [Lewinella marina]|uniref:Uncharacterized protein n=1 Tax=Neolewinella marina TaxID=438751 RepID=A0A2G0CF26_9BACT|nr:hypothetical protein [Neolewinella marina]NJB85742.1 hypothetical protein [Neolewinella marina]PHK98584.1 hypothetical protein CGL56_08910 [Neolewinella marina]